MKITKRQLSKALQEQVKGRKGTIGEILVEMNFCSFEDITDALMNSSEDTKKHEEKHEEIHQEPIVKEEPKPTPVVEQPKKKEPIELSEDKVLDPSLLDKPLLERMPNPTGWRLLILPVSYTHLTLPTSDLV